MLHKTRLLERVVIFCLSLIILTWGLRAQEVIGFDSRFYLFALEMWQYGASWFSTTYHQPYPDYPGTAIFLIYVFSKLWGEVNKLTAILPTALSASFLLTMTYCIGALHNKRWGLYSVFFMLLTIMFLKSARSISLDMYTALITTFSFYLIYSADKENKPKRTLWIYPLLIVGFAFRGPIGLVIPTGVISTYYLLDLNLKRFFIVGLIASLLLALCTIALLVLAYQTGGTNFMHQVLHMEILGRIDNNFLPVYFYFTNSFGNYAISFVIASLVILGAYYSILVQRKSIPEMKFLLKLVGWAMVILIGMSIPGDKKDRYILPIISAIALIAAYPFAITIHGKFFAILRHLWLKVFLYLPVLLMVMIEAVCYYAMNHGLNFNIHYVTIFLFLFVMQVINFWSIFWFRKREDLKNTFILLIATIAFITTYISVIEPIDLSIDRARNFVIAIEKKRIKDHKRLVFYKEKPDGLTIKYLINMDQALLTISQPLFITRPAELISFSEPAFFITSTSYFDELPKDITSKFEMVASDRLGHIPVMVFKRK